MRFFSLLLFFQLAGLGQAIAAEAPLKSKEPATKLAPQEIKQIVDERQAVAVLAIHAVHGVAESIAALLSEVLLTRIGQSGVFSDVIGGSDLREMMSLEQQKSLLGCGSGGCMAALGGALGVPLMIVPSLGKLGGKFILNIKLTNVELAKVVARVNSEVADEAELKAAFEQLIDRLLNEELNNPRGRSEVALERPDVAPTAAFAKLEPASSAPNYSMKALGISVTSVGVALGLGSYSWHQLTLRQFELSEGALIDYDRSLERTYYANMGFGLGLLTGSTGVYLWWRSL